MPVAELRTSPEGFSGGRVDIPSVDVDPLAQSVPVDPEGFSHNVSVPAVAHQDRPPFVEVSFPGVLFEGEPSAILGGVVTGVSDSGQMRPWEPCVAHVGIEVLETIPTFAAFHPDVTTPAGVIAGGGAFLAALPTSVNLGAGHSVLDNGHNANINSSSDGGPNCL